MSNQGPYGPPPGQYQGQYQGPPPQQYGPPPGGQPYWGPPQGPPPGPGFGWGSNGFPPPPKKKSKAAWIIIPIAVVGLALAGAVVLSSILKHNGSDYAQPEPTSTEEPTFLPTTEEPTTVPTKPTAPATSRSTQPQPTKTTPPKPSDTDVVAKNRIYKTGVQKSVNCKESGARANGATNARKYYNAVLACLIKAWPKQVALAGGRFSAPHLVAFSGTAVSPCGGNSPSSFYCSSNRTIYMDVNSDLKWYSVYLRYPNKTQAMAWLRAEMTDTVAHEFGHHVQYMTGILSATDNLEYQFSGDKSLEMSRRLEIQATCLGNVFMGANKSSYGMTGLLKSQLDYLHSHEGDEYGTRRDHGSRAILPRWANAGFVTRSPSACNTYTASPKYVR
ncbi:neutral zinc metallopeptidase [Kribbella sp. NPDC051952]|uniref:neutral zinc metallopeptidase n=1 Tax=Kribbella sp. NPDC051952 TaxID=3154851 RepID=UPI003434BC00